MQTPFSIRLPEDLEKFVESQVTEGRSKTDIIKLCIQRVREELQTGKTMMPDLRTALFDISPTEDAKLREILEKVNSDLAMYWCEDFQLVNKKILEKLKRDRAYKLSELPCLQNTSYDCQFAKSPDYSALGGCPLANHPEAQQWRELIAKHLKK
jgi:Arc/MetJ-type ribon-helix-helix transcriptional regulator